MLLLINLKTLVPATEITEDTEKSVKDALCPTHRLGERRTPAIPLFFLCELCVLRG